MSTTPKPIVDLILTDVNAVMPTFVNLVSSYRLLVGAAEEIRRTPDMPAGVFERAVARLDYSGTLIDILLELLCCKLTFSSDFLSVTCAPVDLFRLLSCRTDAVDTPYHTAEQVLQLEVLRKALEVARGPKCPPPSAAIKKQAGAAFPPEAPSPVKQLFTEEFGETATETVATLYNEVAEELTPE